MISPGYKLALFVLTVLWAAALVSAFLLPGGPHIVTSSASLAYALGGLGCLIFAAWLMIGANRRA